MSKTIYDYNTDYVISNYRKYGISSTLDFKKKSEDSGPITVKFYGYDLFKAQLDDGTVLNTSMDETTHLLSIEIPSEIEEGSLTVTYSEPISFRISDVVSLLSCLSVGVFLLFDKRKGNCSLIKH
jgi:hypothetical protein